MSRINRRTLLANSGSAVMASSFVGTAFAAKPQRRNQGPSCELLALVEAHQAAYAAFGESIREPGGDGCEIDRVSRAEEEALLAVCSYPAVSEGDRLAKAEYLLKIEARGELDLKEHMQAVLRSTMWRALN